jgi:hypothetical protein
VLAVKLGTLRVDFAVELENRGKPLAAACPAAPRSRLLEASRGKKLRSLPETFQLTGAAVLGTARSRHGE